MLPVQPVHVLQIVYTQCETTHVKHIYIICQKKDCNNIPKYKKGAKNVPSTQKPQMLQLFHLFLLVSKTFLDITRHSPALINKVPL